MRFPKNCAGFQSAKTKCCNLKQIADWKPTLKTPLAGYFKDEGISEAA